MRLDSRSALALRYCRWQPTTNLHPLHVISLMHPSISSGIRRVLSSASINSFKKNEALYHNLLIYGAAREGRRCVARAKG